MRILGIDFGDSRIGVAISDPLGWTAQGIDTITYKGDIASPIKDIHELVKKYEVSKIIVGFPINMNGTIGERGRKTQKFIEMLSSVVGVEIVKWDERLTTVSSHRVIKESGRKPSRNKELVDKIAAVYILQSYLDSV